MHVQSARGSHQSANAAAAAATAAAALAEDEDTQLQAAIQASMVQEDRSVPPGSGTDAVMKEEEKERVNAEEVAEAASARLPPEPPAPEGCRIGTYLTYILYTCSTIYIDLIRI